MIFRLQEQFLAMSELGLLHTFLLLKMQDACQWNKKNYFKHHVFRMLRHARDAANDARRERNSYLSSVEMEWKNMFWVNGRLKFLIPFIDNA